MVCQQCVFEAMDEKLEMLRAPEPEPEPEPQPVSSGSSEPEGASGDAANARKVDDRAAVRDGRGDDDDEALQLQQWLAKHNLQRYSAALADAGYDGKFIPGGCELLRASPQHAPISVIGACSAEFLGLC